MNGKPIRAESMTPSIAEDIQMLCNSWIESEITYFNDKEMTEIAKRVEAYLSSFKPDHL